MIENVLLDGEIQAIILRANFQKEGIEFFTPSDFSQQLGYMNRPKGHKIQPHKHRQVTREISLTQEVLFIKTGKVLVNFYNNEQKLFTSEILNEGDIVLLASGGHGFEFLETSEIIEVKQGPYLHKDDKIIFKG